MPGPYDHLRILKGTHGMRLKELEIQGFKSFPDKTKIEIGEGITGVVGPNGSGKSNISDSIRWVLGETSSKQLRGSGKMEDVIFGGTQSRGAMGYASVALTIDNSDHGLDMDADEVTIGRRYYRSGESEYSINGQNVRLKDVYELLLDTGIGRDGYAIVGQGRIAEIVGAKSAERREIFEEASGIAKYRYRKNEAERRLDAAEGNLERLRDILGELEKRVGPLKRDSEKAQQFLELSERRKTLEITLWVDAIRRANDSLRDQQRKYEAAQADYDRLSRQLDEFDEKSASLRAEAQQLMLAVEQANADIRAITEANAGSESEIAVLKNESEHSRFRIDEAASELERAGQGRESIEREAAEINVSLSAGSIEIDEAHSAIRVVKGASMITLDPAAVADRVLSDIRAGKFGTSAYPVDMSGDDKMTLQELHDAVCGDPVNAGYDPETQSATESKVGIEFDVAAAQPLWDAAANGDTVTIPATLTQPEMTQERLQQHLLADKLATKTTSLSGSSSNRITNVKLAAEKINGVILQPGQTFSYNDVVGQRTKANGFKEAGAYSNGQVVQEVGGGICQVSSTLYYCAMVSNLKINTRTCHYFPVSYIEPGMDATVSWGGPEFKFTNNRDYPIEIKAYVQNGSVTVEIWGTDVDGSYVKMSYTSEGLRATTYRTVYDKDGKQISHTLEANSTYHSHDTTPKPTPTPSTAPKPTPTPTPQPQPTPYPSVYDPGDAGED